VEHYIEYKRRRAIVRKMTGRQRRDDWDKFVKTLERDITKLKIDPITETEWREYYGKLWNELGSNSEKGIDEKGSERTDDNGDMMTMVELNKVLKHAEKGKAAD
jgi:hypothetical protein